MRPVMLIDDAYARFRGVDDRYGEAYALSQHGHALAMGGAVRKRRTATCNGLSRFVGTCATSGHWPWHSRVER